MAKVIPNDYHILNVFHPDYPTGHFLATNYVLPFLPPRCSSLLQDDNPMVRRLFLDKLHRLVKMHSTPSRYACAFAVAASDSEDDIRENVWNTLLQMQVHIHHNTQF